MSSLCRHHILHWIIACSSLFTWKTVLSSECYASIISFGDSFIDTGNEAIESKGLLASANPPYGETYFGKPTGRWSNGRLIVDFIAQALGLPLPLPSLAKLKPSSYSKGVSFATGGSFAVNASFYESQNVTVFSNSSLTVQIDWFEELLPSLCSTATDCGAYLKKSLILVGETGGNDYMLSAFSGKTMKELRTLVPRVLNSIVHAINVLVGKGAKEVVVPGLTPFGCLPVVLTSLGPNDTSSYDKYGCLKSFNKLSMFHNSALQRAIKKLQVMHPSAHIMYADYYNVAYTFYKNPIKFGFRNVLRNCCGRGGQYNYSPIPANTCGSPGVPICSNVVDHLNWDGFHYTEKAYRYMASGLLSGKYTRPSIKIPKRCFFRLPTDDPS